MSDTPTEDLGITTGGDTLGHVLNIGKNEGGAFTPDGIASAITKLDTQIKLVDGEIHDYVAAQELSDLGFMTDWSSFVIEWYDWKSAHSSWVSDAWNQTRSDLLDRRETYERLRANWAGIFPATRSLAFTVKDAPANTIEDFGLQIGAALKHIAVGAAWVTVAIAAAVVVWKYR